MRFIYVRASFQSELRTPNPVRTEDGGEGDEEEIAKAIQRAHGSRAHGGSGRLHDVTEAFTQPVAARLLFTIVNRTRKHVPRERAGKETLGNARAEHSNAHQDSTKSRVRPPDSEGNQMHSSIVWTLRIPKM